MSRLPRPVSIALKVLLSAGIIGYLVWQINIGQTVRLIGNANGLYLIASLALFLVTTVGMAWRWQLLLAAKGLIEPLGWLTKLYFIGNAAGQILPTGIGGDAARIIEHSRRQPDHKGEVAGAVIMERVIGAAGTLVLVAIGLVVAIGRYDGIEYLVAIEVAFLLLVAAGFALLFSKRAAVVIRPLAPFASKLRLERAARSVYRAMHGYRSQPRALIVVLVVTIVMQLGRTVSIWLCGLAVGVDVSPLVYVILGPLLFLVMLVPFTINGLGVREAFFVAFLGRFGVGADAAFATGFLFYAVAIASCIPGGAILLWRSARPAVVRAERGT